VAVTAPDRGDLVWLNFTPQAGHEQAGSSSLRSDPAVVLSPRAYNSRAGLAIVVPVTTRPKGRPFEVPLAPGLTVRGVVPADQVRSVDWSARGVEHAGRLPAETARRLLE
jgi:mRNA interferase MazF